MSKKITFISGNPEDGSSELDKFHEDLLAELKKEAYELNYIKLVDEEIKFCIGCWDCWWKTPGLCRHDDSMSEILRSIINSDLLVFSSPVIMGFYSALLKKCHDRLIPLVHPYIEFVNKEMHHIKRYPAYPMLGVILDSSNAKDEELDVIRIVFDRLALNFKSEVKFFHVLNSNTIATLKNEINSL